MNDCIQSNTIGSNAVFDFCLKNRIKLIYSATSASLGNRGKDKNLSPYAFTKAKNLEFLENLKKWFNFKYEIIFFYNVYGPNQISKGRMATVIGIFENCYQKKNRYQLLNLALNQEDLHILMILSRYVIRHGKKINVNIMQFQIKKVIQF